MVKHQQKQDFTPLVILSSIAFIIILLIIISGKDILSLLIYLPPLFLLSGILYTKGIKKNDVSFSMSLFWLAYIIKLISSATNYWFITTFYGAGDANAYHRGGVFVAQYFTQFDFSVFDFFSYGGQGATNMMFLTGLVYTFLPPSLIGSFFLFASLAFAGSVYFYLAYRIAFPNTQPNLFRLSIFFLPSILYWPSALGKDAWIFFNLGLVTYGLAVYLRQGRIRGLLLIGMGFLLISPIRPHIIAFLGVAIGGAYVLSFFKSSTTVNPRQFGTSLISGLFIITLTVLAVQNGNNLFEFDEFTQEEVETFYDSQQSLYLNTNSGQNSNYQADSAFSLTGAIRGIITVLFRPFPWEAHSIPVFIASLESTLLLIALLSRRHVLWSRISNFRTDPWIVFLLIYTLIMMLSLTVMSNFGLLARQRVMLLPFLWMLFA